MITVSALLPLYKRVGMNPVILAAVAYAINGRMNMTPWGGASAMAMSSLNLDPSELFLPLIPVIGFWLLWVLVVSFILGKRERKRLGIMEIEYTHQQDSELAATIEHIDYRHPKLV